MPQTTTTTPTGTSPFGGRRRCRRCQATDNLRLEQSLTIWNEAMKQPQLQNIYICLDRKACSERVNEASQQFKEADLWENYNQNCRARRYTPRKYWRGGRRLTFAIALALFARAGRRLEKGRSDFPAGLKSDYIVDRRWRYTSLLEAIKLIEPPCGRRPKKKTTWRCANNPACEETRQ